MSSRSYLHKSSFENSLLTKDLANSPKVKYQFKCIYSSTHRYRDHVAGHYVFSQKIIKDGLMNCTLNILLIIVRLHPCLAQLRDVFDCIAAI